MPIGNRLILKAILFCCLFLAPHVGLSQDFLQRFPFQKQTTYFDFRYERDSPQIPTIARFADGFIDLVNRDFFDFHFDYPIRVLVLEDRAQFKEFLVQQLHTADPPNFGIYVPPFKLFATYEDSGIGTFTHEILHPLIKSNLTDRPLWAEEGIPTFFEKFYGYWKNDRLVVFWGYQNPWRIAQLGPNLTHIDLSEIISDRADLRAVEHNESALRMVSVFLWQQGCFRRFLKLIASHDKAPYPTYFEAVLQMPMDRILPLWHQYLDDVAEKRAEILRLPVSTICPDETNFQQFIKTNDISLEQSTQRN